MKIIFLNLETILCIKALVSSKHSNMKIMIFRLYFSATLEILKNLNDLKFIWCVTKIISILIFNVLFSTIDCYIWSKWIKKWPSQISIKSIFKHLIIQQSITTACLFFQDRKFPFIDFVRIMKQCMSRIYSQILLELI